jgi:hypothetical protein
MYINQMAQGTDYTMQFYATGSTPLAWSLAPIRVGSITHVETVPAEASIDSGGNLTIKGSIPVVLTNLSLG